MSTEKVVMPDYLFEASWEVCNKVGGIHTVLATKSLNLSEELGGNHIHIGPDVWVDTDQNHPLPYLEDSRRRRRTPPEGRTVEHPR